MKRVAQAQVKKWPKLPADVIAWFRSIWAEANRKVTERLVNVPNIRETTLDDGLVEALVPDSAPLRLSSGAIVEMNVHNIGGLRRLGAWEIADIAVLIFVYRGAQLIAQKVGFLQSKRLRPLNADIDDEDPVGFQFGMNAFLNRDPTIAIRRLHRQYEFNDACIYHALQSGSEQIRVIDEMNQRLGDAVYYLFYNPARIPCTIRYPLRSRISIGKPKLGCRVYLAPDVHRSVQALPPGQAPTLGMLERASPASNWRLETWAADLLLKCKVGQPFRNQDGYISELLYRRTGPIGAAIATAIILPD